MTKLDILKTFLSYMKESKCYEATHIVVTEDGRINEVLKLDITRWYYHDLDCWMPAKIEAYKKDTLVEVGNLIKLIAHWEGLK